MTAVSDLLYIKHKTNLHKISKSWDIGLEFYEPLEIVMIKAFMPFLVKFMNAFPQIWLYSAGYIYRALLPPYVLLYIPMERQITYDHMECFKDQRNMLSVMMYIYQLTETYALFLNDFVTLKYLTTSFLYQTFFLQYRVSLQNT